MLTQHIKIAKTKQPHLRFQYIWRAIKLRMNKSLSTVIVAH